MGLSENIVASNSKRLLGSFPVQIAIWIHLGGIPIFRQSLKLGSMRFANYTSQHIPLYISSGEFTYRVEVSDSIGTKSGPPKGCFFLYKIKTHNRGLQGSVCMKF
jgi:hypothetical protein